MGSGCGGYANENCVRRQWQGISSKEEMHTCHLLTSLGTVVEGGRHAELAGQHGTCRGKWLRAVAKWPCGRGYVSMLPLFPSVCRSKVFFERRGPWRTSHSVLRLVWSKAWSKWTTKDRSYHGFTTVYSYKSHLMWPFMLWFNVCSKRTCDLAVCLLWCDAADARIAEILGVWEVLKYQRDVLAATPLC